MDIDKRGLSIVDACSEVVRSLHCLKGKSASRFREAGEVLARILVNHPSGCVIRKTVNLPFDQLAEWLERTPYPNLSSESLCFFVRPKNQDMEEMDKLLAFGQEIMNILVETMRNDPALKKCSYAFEANPAEFGLALKDFDLVSHRLEIAKADYPCKCQKKLSGKIIIFSTPLLLSFLDGLDIALSDGTVTSLSDWIKISFSPEVPAGSLRAEAAFW